MRLIFLSPHLDDAIYSCGGTLWQQRQQGHPVEIWTIFAGDPSGDLTPFAHDLHTRWGVGNEAVKPRRMEDITACRMLGVQYRHFSYPDCIYRRIPTTGEPVIMVNDDLFKPVKEGEQPLAHQIAADLVKSNPEGALVLCPLGVGGHVDHRLTRMAAEFSGLPLAFYADFPYSADPTVDIASLIPSGNQPIHLEFNDLAIDHWIKAVGAYRSQLSSFWVSESQMAEEVRAYAHTTSGSSFWMQIAYSQNQ